MTQAQAAPPAQRGNGWGGRDRTYECRNQNPVPYHLATPQGKTYATATSGVSPQRVAGKRARNKSGDAVGHPRERPLRGVLGGETRQKRTPPTPSSAPPIPAPRARAHRDSGRPPGTAPPQRETDRCGHILRKRLPFSRTRCCVSILAPRRSPRSAPRSPGSAPRTTSSETSSPASSSPMPRAKAGWPKTKNGTSAPSSSANCISASRDRSSCHNRLSPSSTVAASELPPPRPPPIGSRLSTPIDTPRRRRNAAGAVAPRARRGRRRARRASGAACAHDRAVVTRGRAQIESPRAISTNSDSSVW